MSTKVEKNCQTPTTQSYKIDTITLGQYIVTNTAGGYVDFIGRDIIVLIDNDNNSVSIPISQITCVYSNETVPDDCLAKYTFSFS